MFEKTSENIKNVLIRVKWDASRVHFLTHKETLTWGIRMVCTLADMYAAPGYGLFIASELNFEWLSWVNSNQCAEKSWKPDDRELVDDTSTHFAKLTMYCRHSVSTSALLCSIIVRRLEKNMNPPKRFTTWESCLDWASRAPRNACVPDVASRTVKN